MKTLHARWIAGLSLVSLLIIGTVATSAAVLKVPSTNYPTIDAAVAAATDGDTIMVGPGEFAGCWVYKKVHIRGIGKTTITDGVNFGYIFGFIFVAGSDGATITNLAFTVDFPIYGTWANNVTVTHCTMSNPVQGVSVCEGSGWTISHNTIVDLWTEPIGPSGAHGIAFVHRYGGAITGNVVSHNVITGTVSVLPGDHPDWPRSGIAFFVDKDESTVFENVVEYNTISLVSSDPAICDVAGVLLQDMRPDSWMLDPNITENLIQFNDMRGTATAVALLPIELNEVNYISRNLGNNRGHGLHP